MEAFLAALLPRVLPEGRTPRIHVFQGKHDLLRKLEDRLRGYARWLPPESCVVVMVDRDDEDCRARKNSRKGLKMRQPPWACRHVLGAVADPGEWSTAS